MTFRRLAPSRMPFYRMTFSRMTHSRAVYEI
jgi:hypothetical protein